MNANQYINRFLYAEFRKLGFVFIKKSVWGSRYFKYPNVPYYLRVSDHPSPAPSDSVAYSLTVTSKTIISDPADVARKTAVVFAQMAKEKMKGSNDI
jgi:hypothetical protein